MGEQVVAAKMLTRHQSSLQLTIMRLGAALLLSAASAMPAIAQAPTVTAFDPSSETAPTSRAIVAVTSLLSQGGFEEARIRGAGGLTHRATFTAAGASLSLQASADATVPRRAFAGPGSSGAAFLVLVPDVIAGVAPDDPARAPHYALATVVGTRLAVWAFFSALPSDAVLSRRMIAALAKLEKPLLVFDTAFQPGTGIGADRYALK